MDVEVNGTRLWFDVEGAGLVVDGSTMRERPTVVLLHGGPGSFDHSYFKPDFVRLADAAQIVYLDLPGHGRSEWGEPEEWSFETCADAVRNFCDAVGIVSPVIYGHSLGAMVALAYAARHPGHPGALVLQSAMARFDLGRIVEGFRRAGGDEVAAIAERAYSGADTSEEEWDRCWRLFGHWVPDDAEKVNRELGAHGSSACRGSTSSATWAGSSVSRWSASASSTPSLRWPRRRRSPRRYPVPGSRCSRGQATSPGRTHPIATGRCSRSS
jgi:pimeloyl-ACP methyl ester carboxylesterase